MPLTAPHHYRDRIEAGHVLARHLAPYAGRVDTLVLALPRGGIPVGVEVAAYLTAPLDAFLVRKLGLPQNPDCAMGAIASGGVSVFDDELIQTAGVTPAQLAAITAEETAELARREAFYRDRRPPPRIAGRVILVVDDELATGLSMHAAVMALHRHQPAWLVVAAPVGSDDACTELANEVHEVVCPFRTASFRSGGRWYDRFSPIEDEDIRTSLRRASALPRS